MKTHHFSLYSPLLLAAVATLLVGQETPAPKTETWVMGHVRAGKEVFRKEIEEAGLTFIEEVKMDGFKDNYFLRFRKD